MLLGLPANIFLPTGAGEGGANEMASLSAQHRLRHDEAFEQSALNESLKR